jgi:hypothetical protein
VIGHQPTEPANSRRVESGVGFFRIEAHEGKRVIEPEVPAFPRGSLGLKEGPSFEGALQHGVGGGSR